MTDRELTFKQWKKQYNLELAYYEQYKKLPDSNIGKQKKQWNKYYELAKAYYEYYGNLEVHSKFKTINGYEYDEKGLNLGAWIVSQRMAYNGKRKSEMTDDRIYLLEQIGISWINIKTDTKNQTEIITEKNLHQKQISMLNRFKTVLNTYSELPPKEQITEDFIDELNYKKNR